MGTIKYNISKFSKSIYYIALLYGVVGAVIGIWEYGTLGLSFGTVIVFIMAGVVIFCGLYLIFFDAPSGKFSYDSNGITLFVGFKSYHHKWDEFKWLDVIPISVESIGAKTIANMYVVWFSTRCLSLEERRDFMGKGRKDLNSVAWFQYRPELVSEIIGYLPIELAELLQKKDKLVQENMNILDHFYNKD